MAKKRVARGNGNGKAVVVTDDRFQPEDDDYFRFNLAKLVVRDWIAPLPVSEDADEAWAAVQSRIGHNARLLDIVWPVWGEAEGFRAEVLEELVKLLAQPQDMEAPAAELLFRMAVWTQALDVSA